MANVLLVDPAEVARKALQGILARGRHRVAAVSSAHAALEFLGQNVGTDLLILEMDLEGSENGLALLETIRADRLFGGLPVVVYTTGHRELAPQAIALRVQNFLVKPYVDNDLFMELGKATAHPWQAAHFAEEKTFCVRQRIQPEELRHRFESLHAMLDAAAKSVPALAGARDGEGITGQLEDLLIAASDAGATAVTTLLEALWESLEQGNWDAVAASADQLAVCARIVLHRITPGHVSEGFLSDQERNAQEEAKARTFWANAIAEGSLPVIPRSRLEREMDDLPGFPIIDSVAAAFQMAATGKPSSLAPLMDITEVDPGLSAQLLISANRARRADEVSDDIENARLAVGLLGEERLSQLAVQLATVEARHMEHPPLTWPQYWMFQLGVATLARHTCTYLGLESLESRAYTAGLLHDIGRLLMLRLEPVGVMIAVDYARRHRLSLAAAERKLLDCTSRELAVIFGERHGLPPCYVNVIRWVDTPAEAREDAALVAIVSLARDLCVLNHVGCSGDPRQVDLQPLDQSSEWRILRSYVFPSFDLQKFEAQVHAMSRELTRELSGRNAQANH